MIDVVVSFDVTPTDGECPLDLKVWLDNVAVATVDCVNNTHSITVQYAGRNSLSSNRNVG